MRRTAIDLLARAAALLLLALTLAAPARAFTNTTTGVVNVAGSVALVCSVAVNSSGATTVFPDMTRSAVNTLIGTVVETCNDINGYKVSLTSANGGVFRGAATNAFIPYLLTYNGSAVLLDEGGATITPCGGRTTAQGVSKPLAISFAGAWYTADTYSDTLTLTMTAQ